MTNITLHGSLEASVVYKFVNKHPTSVHIYVLVHIGLGFMASYSRAPTPFSWENCIAKCLWFDFNSSLLAIIVVSGMRVFFFSFFSLFSKCIPMQLRSFFFFLRQRIRTQNNTGTKRTIKT